MLEDARARPGVVRVAYALSGLALVVWVPTLAIGVVAPDLTVGLAAPGAAPTVWSRYGAALAIMIVLAGVIMLGIRHDRPWTRPLIPLCLAIDPLLQGMRAQSPSVSQALASLGLAAVVALILHTWPSSRRYYATIAARETGTVPSFTD